MNLRVLCTRCLTDSKTNIKHVSGTLSGPFHISQKQDFMAPFDLTLSEARAGSNIASSRGSLTNSTLTLRPQRAACSGLELNAKSPISVLGTNTHKYINTVLNSCNGCILTSRKFSTEIAGDRAKQTSDVNSSREGSDKTGNERGIVEPEYLYFHSSCHPETRASVISSFEVKKEFISEEEEAVLMKEVEPHLKRLKYEYDHWDDAIHGFRETERSRWGKVAAGILGGIREYAFPEKERHLPQIHVLDLAKTGVIKPHVDSVRFCGNIICGLCLLSDAVMRLVHVEHKDQVIDVLLQRRSLYVMKDVARYKYTHEVLGENESYFGTELIPRERRVSIMCRNHTEDGKL